MDIRLNTKRILIYFAIAFGIPWASALVISITPMMKNDPAQAMGLANIFFISTPWLGNIAARLITREGWGDLRLRPNIKRGWRFYLAVWLLPLLATVVGGTIFFLLFPRSFDPHLGGVRALVENTPAAVGMNPWVILLSMTFNIVLITVPINTLASMGEEFGWRAYLLPKLVERFARAGFAGENHAATSTDDHTPAGTDAAEARKAALVTGLIHGVWHWPLILMSMNFTPGVTLLTPLVYLVFTCSLSILLSWATLRSGSVWPASLGHGAANAFSILPTYLLLGSAIPLIGPDVTGLVGGIGFTLLALILFFNRKAFAGRKENRSEKTRAVVGVENL